MCNGKSVLGTAMSILCPFTLVQVLSSSDTEANQSNQSVNQSVNGTTYTTRHHTTPHKPTAATPPPSGFGDTLTAHLPYQPTSYSRHLLIVMGK